MRGAQIRIAVPPATGQFTDGTAFWILRLQLLMAPARVQPDGIVYPSIRADKFGVNVALKTESTDRLYHPVSCVVYRVVEAHERFPFTVGKLCWSKSISADGRIEWEIPEAKEAIAG